MSGLKLSMLLFCSLINTPLANAAPQGKVAIVNYLEGHYGPTYADLLKKAGLTQLQAIHLRLYKEERELEIWAGENGDKLTLLATIPICAMDFVPGPKLRVGDERTPEGVYAIYPRYSSNNWFMRIPLATELLDQSPDQLTEEDYFGKGSVFFYCTDYPNNEDRQRSQKIGISNPGSAICLHGNCVTAGCPSMNNRDWTTIYYFLTKHNTKKYGAPKVYIAPFRAKNMEQKVLEAKALSAAAYNGDTNRLGKQAIASFWQRLIRAEKSFKEAPALNNIDLGK